MTKITTKGRYALRIMLDLACNAQASPVSLRGIAERENLAIKYLESIASVLLRKKLIVSTRGKDGGYTLARPVHEYTVYQILTAAEGSMAPAHCLANAGAPCPLRGHCRTRPLWEGLEQVVKDYLEGIHLSDLVDPQDTTSA